jgi:hypothetical protein
MTTRFNKAKLISDLDERVNLKIKLYNFNQNGLSQIWPKNVTDREKEQIMQAFEYGRFIEVKAIAEWIDNGSLGK